jgi:murein DD-endopeptidase MepM/ murein hydrolase activator NlpD
MTGLATGPHLHFNFMQGGVHRNFEVVRRNLPSAQPVAQADIAEFTALREQVMARMEDSGNGPAARAVAGSATVAPPLRPASLR